MRTKAIFTWMAFALAISPTARAYAPPAGIPNPRNSFGAFDPIEAALPDTRVHCPGWHEATPRVNSRASGDVRDSYYIANFHPSATDSSNPYGSPSRPRKTVPNIVYTAGDYVEIHGDGDPSSLANPYTLALAPRGAGTDTNPIWFVGIGKPVFTKTAGFGGTSAPLLAYMVFDGIYWRGDTAVDIRPRFADNEIRNLVFRNCSMSGTGLGSNTTGVFVGAAGLSIPTARTANIVFHRCEISRYGDPAAPGEECGIYQKAFVSGLWVLDCDLHHLAEDGIQGGHSMKRTSTGFYIGGCRIHDNVTNGIDLKQVGAPVVISGCEIYGHWAATPNTTGSGENVVVHYSGASTPGAEADAWKNYPEDITVVGCSIHDGDYGIVGSVTERLRIVGNLFHGIRHSLAAWNPGSVYSSGTAVHLRSHRGDFQIVHNTVYGCDNGIQIPDNPAVYNATTRYYRGSVAANEDRSRYYVCIADESGAGIVGTPTSDPVFWVQMKHQIWGNILANRREAGGRDLYVGNVNYGNGALQIDYNILFSPEGESISYGGSTVMSLPIVQDSLKRMPNSLKNDPLLTSPATLDFSLRKESPAVDFVGEGAGLSAYADFQARYGVDIRRDRLGGSRPAGDAWDGGCEERPSFPTRLGRPKVEVIRPE